MCQQQIDERRNNSYIKDLEARKHAAIQAYQDLSQKCSILIQERSEMEVSTLSLSPT